MKQLLPLRLAAVLAAAILLTATPARAQQQVAIPEPIAAMARALAAELLMQCPLADANDTAAFESCREALQGDSVLQSYLPEIVLWGREGPDGQPTLRQAAVTQLAPEVWTHLYAPLFMFNGNHKVEWVPRENLFVIRLEAAFRNRLAPGQFPYPFWHEQGKWAAYQNANGLLLWVQPQTARIHLAQFTDRAATALLQPVEPVARQFDGQWLWTDQAGRTQPAVTLFDGLYRSENPYRGPLDRQYRDLALQMREAQCSSCHVPSNPGQARRLVLLSTPAHAAGEIERVIRSVREDRMPAGGGRQGHALSADDKKWLLQSAEAFRDTVRAARAWEMDATRRERAATWRPLDKSDVSLRPTATSLSP
jgi:hypothetical protein